GQTGNSGQLLASTGSQLNWINSPTSTTVNNNADNRVITGSDTEDELNGESNLTFDGSTLTINGDAIFTGDNYNAQWNKSDNELEFADNAAITFGNAGGTPDLKIYHAGDHSYIIDQGTGELRIRTNLFNVQSADGSKTMIGATEGNNVNLYYNNNIKLTTQTGGISITGGLQDKDGQYGTSGQVLTSTGSQLDWKDPTDIDAITINNNADNRLITGSNTINTLNGEPNLTFDGSKLRLP
ncbi:uncharacterized protein METZ01_LOCUS486583, partial [marine metagenome]